MGRAVIVGSGVVGTATGKGFADSGHQVQFVDINPGRVEDLRQEGFAASTVLDLSGPPTFIFLTVPTPSSPAGYDLGALEAGVRSVGEALRHAGAWHTVVVRSTVAPGTCENVVKPLLEQASGRRVGEQFALASNPEFLRAASAREDFLMPWMTVIGSRSRRTVERLVEFYDGFGGEVRTFSSPAEAELAKCAHNLFNATKISFWNEMWKIGQRLGVGVDEVAATVARSAEGSINPEYGIKGGKPFGGACLPKDIQGFLGFAAELGMEMPILEAVIRTNDSLAAERNGHRTPKEPVEIRLSA
ncbi:MAG: UDP-glucose/GDP-mannose dehydrogenase family protein [Actinomycetota bacterium]|nr:UDP-glucose/GDP-mannose dehydrogenase family protein [Actinomycetota bacterium]